MKKLYYNINEVAAMDDFRCNASKIRFYEKKFNLTVARNSAGDRIYTEKDIERLKQVFHLKKEKGFTIEGTRQQLSKAEKYKDGKIELIEKLKQFKMLLVDIRGVMEDK